MRAISCGGAEGRDDEEFWRCGERETEDTWDRVGLGVVNAQSCRSILIEFGDD
jgi:hypothetical protein